LALRSSIHPPPRKRSLRFGNEVDPGIGQVTLLVPFWTSAGLTEFGFVVELAVSLIGTFDVDITHVGPASGSSRGPTDSSLFLWRHGTATPIAAKRLMSRGRGGLSSRCGRSPAG